MRTCFVFLIFLFRQFSLHLARSSILSLFYSNRITEPKFSTGVLLYMCERGKEQIRIIIHILIGNGMKNGSKSDKWFECACICTACYYLQLLRSFTKCCIDLLLVGLCSMEYFWYASSYLFHEQSFHRVWSFQKRMWKAQSFIAYTVNRNNVRAQNNLLLRLSK